MSPKTTDTVVMLSDVDCEMLTVLRADERDLIERVLQQDPKINVEKAIQLLRAFSISVDGRAPRNAAFAA
jgi:hypothetical protein